MNKITESEPPKVREAILSLAQRLTDYIDGCDYDALKDLGTLCYGGDDDDIKTLNDYMETQYGNSHNIK
jgi:hypothetical protein